MSSEKKAGPTMGQRWKLLLLLRAPSSVLLFVLVTCSLIRASSSSAAFTSVTTSDYCGAVVSRAATSIAYTGPVPSRRCCCCGSSATTSNTERRSKRTQQYGIASETFPSPAAASMRSRHGARRPSGSLLFGRRGDDSDDDDVLAEGGELTAPTPTTTDDINAPLPSSSSSTPPPSVSTRRTALLRSSLAATSILSLTSYSTNAIDIPNILTPEHRRTSSSSTTPPTYQQAPRSTSYLVDSTIPPTLVPYRASREAAILKQIGSGLGTTKDPVLENKLTLNNMMNKGVFGTINAIGNVLGTNTIDDSNNGRYATFVFLGMNDITSTKDVDLSLGLLENIIKPRKNLKTALGLSYVPLSAQEALDTYSRGGGNEVALIQALTQAGVDKSVLQSHLPLIQYGRSKNLPFLALSPEYEDITSVRQNGLQSLDINRRSSYVIDSEGFIQLTQDPKFKLYTDKSLLKEFSPLNDKDTFGDYFAEKILVHETAATVLGQYGMSRPGSLVVTVAEMEDVRFMGGMNGRVPRVCNYLLGNNDVGGKLEGEEGGGTNRVDEEAVTTILLNPTAEKTLSKSKFLRLEIGTAPENKAYQTKIADYLWFTSMPKVNMLPRMMNPP